MSNNIIDSIKLSGTVYTLSAQTSGGGNPTVELTQAEYDALVTAGTVSADTYYIITDAQAGDLTNYYTKTETNNAITAATSTKQDTLVSGTNIKTINNESLLGSGNIDIQGGGKAVSGGTNISITTGETADTINCTLPISADTRQYGTNLILFNYSNTINHNQTKGNLVVGSNNIFGNYYEQAQNNFVFGNTNTLEGYASGNRCLNNFVVGNGNFFGNVSTKYAVSNTVVFGDYNKPKNNYEFIFGQYNNSVSASTTFGDSGNTLFSVGNGTADNARHNAFEIRQNGDIYISSGGTDIKLQDNLGGGGGGSITIDPSLDSGSTNAVANSAITIAIDAKQDTLSAGTNITIVDNVISAQLEGGAVSRADVEDMISAATSGLVESSAITSAVTSASTDSEIPTAKAVFDAIPTGGTGGMTEDDELLLATALTDLNDRKIDASEVKSSYQKKGDYATKSYVTTALEPYETKLDEINTEEVTAYALNDLNDRFGGLKIVKITESEYASLTTKDENTLYIVVTDPS